MKASLVLTQSQWQELDAHLWASDVHERFAVLLVGFRIGRGEIALLCNKVVPYADPRLIDDRFGIRLSPHGVVSIVNAALGAGTGVVEVHTHPGTDRPARFSSTDEEGHLEIVPYVLSSLPTGLPYASIVMGRSSASGLAWLSSDTAPTPISIFRIAGMPDGLFGSPGLQHVQVDEARYTRQASLLGRDGQRKIGSVRVGIVGLGGTGSVIARTLAYEGVRSFVLVDHDRVAASNLNRLDGAYPRDAWLRRMKVSVARRAIRKIAPGSRVVSIARSLFTKRALEQLAQCDIIFGCTDNHGTRLCLNELSAAYLLPYFDVGSGIQAEQGAASEAGGRVTVVMPGDGCLLCANAVNARLGGHQLSGKALQEFAVAQGYVEGEDVPSPSVMSLNQVVAALAVTEFKAWVTGFREPVRQVIYDLLSGSMSPLVFSTHAKCVVCRACVGKGDLLGLTQRYVTR